jgi:hypothetical protein
MHATMSQPLVVAIESSMKAGIMEDAINSVAAQSMPKNRGCDARMMRWCLFHHKQQ